MITVSRAHYWNITLVWDCSSKTAQYVAVKNDPKCLSGSSAPAHTWERTQSVSNMKASLDERSWMYIGCHTQGLVFLSYFNQIWNVLTNFIKNSKYATWNPVCGSPLIHADRQTVRCDEACPVVHTNLIKNGIALCLYF